MILEEICHDMKTAIEYGRTDVVKAVLDSCKLETLIIYAGAFVAICFEVINL